MSVREHKRAAPARLRVAVLTASDSRSAATDDSGHLLVELLARAGHAIAGYRVVKDDVRAIRAAARDLLRDADALLVNGGTGASPRDVTPEALAPLLRCELPGFGEAFRRASAAQVGTAAIASRALAGVTREGKIVAALPGSPQGCRLAMRAILLPELSHLVHVARGRPPSGTTARPRRRPPSRRKARAAERARRPRSR
ncbi:MAG TPA: molybdenum cofactor biosynthesis protein B [Candidatus Thermoplasmatota archaeon]|nr:molybdenum cofactor biosynthesis protein B [Candidatus Thermoplasmatota archaeon]